MRIAYGALERAREKEAKGRFGDFIGRNALRCADERGWAEKEAGKLDF